MVYVGIDIAKPKHFTTDISSDSEIPMEQFKFTNDSDEFSLLESSLANFNLCLAFHSQFSFNI